jgi:hypothetical protein
MDLMLYLFVNFLALLISIQRKCCICDIIVLNKVKLMKPKHICLYVRIVYVLLYYYY